MFWFFRGSEDRRTSMVKREEILMTMAKIAPLASQDERLNEKTNVGIGISSVELVSVAKDNDGSDRCGKKFGKRNVTFNVET